MRIAGFLCFALVGVATVVDQEPVGNSTLEDAPVPPPTPAPTPACKHVEKGIHHDKIKPFPQLDAVSIPEKAAVKFRPMLKISHGCHAYPMVNAEGETSGGLKTTGPSDGNCKGAQWGSQVYARSTWYKGVWAIVYVWYFPKDSTSHGLGHRHDFEQVVVWIDNPANVNPKILGVSLSSHGGFWKHAPPHSSTLPEKARCALNSVYWGDANLPIRDENFRKNLDEAYPF
ncbi:unnamed protein product [Peronospora destructor]|uniref:Uncharacterized protein n=1 Tax=Peronospora destructor TaxID=86335 RepID=A0AAV0SYE0_9STRA|nr:unnamed protein product [Peronospora destructor]